MSLNKSIVFNFLVRFGTALFNLFLAVLISQILGAEKRGEQALFVTSVALIQLFTNWLGGSSLVYLASRHSIKLLLGISSLWALFTASIAWGIIVLLGLITPAYYPFLWVSAVLFAFWSNLSNVLLGKEKTDSFNLLQVLAPGLTLCFFLIWLFGIEKSLDGFVWAYTLAQAITLLVAFRKTSPLWQHEAPGSWKQLLPLFLRHGVFIQLANVTQFLNYRMLYYFIEHHFSKQFLGVYSNAISLAESVWMITRSISTIQFARIANNEDDATNRKLTNRFTAISLGLSALLMLIMLLLPDHFFVWLFGKEFSGIHTLLLYLTPAILAMSASNIFAHYFAGIGLNGVNFLGSLSKLVFLLIGFFLWKGALHENAAPLATSAGFLCGLLFHGLVYRFWSIPASKQA